MNEEKYLFQNEMIVLKDDEMGLDLQLPFKPLLLYPSLLSSYSSLEGERLVLERVEDGTIASAYFEKEGKREGQFRTFYPKGNVQSEGYYREGELHGPSRFFSENGTLLSESWFIKGMQTGKSCFYYASGKLYAKKRYSSGLLEGMQEYFYAAGSTRTLMPYSLGKLHGEVKLFWENGRLKRSASYKEGKRNGWDKIWNEKGELVDEGQFQEGAHIGIHVRRWPNGNKREELFYHSPERYDRREWNEEGEPTYEGVYGADLRYSEKKWKAGKTPVVREGKWDGKKICWT